MITGLRPDITPAQIIGGIPLIANLLAAFGVYTLTPDQQDALTQASWWAGGLLFADAGIRIGRNIAIAKTDPESLPPAPVAPPTDEELAAVEDEADGGTP